MNLNENRGEKLDGSKSGDYAQLGIEVENYMAKSGDFAQLEHTAIGDQLAITNDVF